MDGRGECCIARYSGVGAACGGVYEMSKVDRIMLRFRPIAPKPSTGSSASPPVNSEIYVKPGKGKRRSPNKNNGEAIKRCNRKRRALPLLPEKPASDGTRVDSPKAEPVWLNFSHMYPAFGISADRTAVITPAHTVTVECVTETWVDGNGLGRTDEERRVNLANDTCPGFVSDGFERVTWTNAAFREMVGGGGDAEMGVFLVMKERPMLTYPTTFTCRVRVQISGKENKSSLTLPCDVWRMNRGGFAWRLDLTAALRLGPV